MTESDATVRLRADKWLWFARIIKTRTLAASLIKSGKVRINAERFSSPSRAVGPGDVLTVTLPRQIKVLKIIECGARRGPAPEAQRLYEDLSPPVPKSDTIAPSIKPAEREEGAGRPTKKERRELSRFRSQAGEEF